MLGITSISDMLAVLVLTHPWRGGAARARGWQTVLSDARRSRRLFVDPPAIHSARVAVVTVSLLDCLRVESHRPAIQNAQRHMRRLGRQASADGNPAGAFASSGEDYA